MWEGDVVYPLGGEWAWCVCMRDVCKPYLFSLCQRTHLHTCVRSWYLYISITMILESLLQQPLHTSMSLFLSVQQEPRLADSQEEERDGKHPLGKVDFDPTVQENRVCMHVCGAVPSTH